MHKNLTIAIVDTSNHALASAALDQAIRITNSKSALVLSDRNFYPGSKFVKINPISDKTEYSRLMIKEIGKHIETDHFMVIQYDGMPTDANKWNNDFLKYDYIGAPWPWGPVDRRVGNGGFSIRSRKLSDLCLTENVVFDNSNEDTFICQQYRDFLEHNGIRFSPIELAKNFSAEIPGGKFPTYGFHGTLCLPFYLSDTHLALYIDNMTDSMVMDPVQIRILFGLYRAERYNHLEQLMDRGVATISNYKEIVLNQLAQENQVYSPNPSVKEFEDLLGNY
jgi:hypothetical protein